MHDPSRLATYFEAHSAQLVLYARQFVDRAAAEDVVHDAFAALLSQARQPDDVRAWLFRAVRNGAISRKRSWWRRLRRERAVSESRGEMFESRAEDLLDATAAQEALCDLPQEQREVVVLRIWGQLGFTEIARLVDASVSTVHGRYSTAIATMKRRLESKPCPTTTHP